MSCKLFRARNYEQCNTVRKPPGEYPIFLLRKQNATIVYVYAARIPHPSTRLPLSVKFTQTGCVWQQRKARSTQMTKKICLRNGARISSRPESINITHDPVVVVVVVISLSVGRWQRWAYK